MFKESRSQGVKETRRCFVLILFLAGWLLTQAQERSLFDSLAYRAEVQATVSGGDHNPLWLNANKYGLSSLKNTNGYLRGAIERPLCLDNGRKWGVGYGLDVAVAAGFTSTLVVQQAFVEARWLKGTLTVGAKEQPMELKNQELSSGSQTLGINARPVPQVRLALPDYWTIPHTKNWLALKGHIAYGKTTDDGWQKDFTERNSRYSEGTLYHSKAGYLKVGPKNFTVEMGVEMACQFGGTSFIRQNGEMVAIENEKGLKSWWHALMPGGAGSDEGNSTYQNADGNQMGSWVIRVNYDTDNWRLSAYADHYFEDHSSMFLLDYDGYGSGNEWNEKKDSRYFFYGLKDIMVGVELNLKKNDWLNAVVLEYLCTKHQSGPVYHDHSQLISTHLGGMDNYYNHHLYTGWQHWGQVMGNPLYLSPLYQEGHDIEVGNNRFVAWHLGLSGRPLKHLDYRVLATYQTGYGTYHKPYLPERHQFSMLAEACYKLMQGWSVKGALGFDSGKILGDNFGVQFTIIKQGVL